MSEMQPIQPDGSGANPPQDDLAGYPDTGALVRGYRASGEEAKRQRERAERAEALLKEVQQQWREPRPEIPPARTQTFEDYGIPTPLLDQYFDQRFQQAMGPVAKSFEARNNLLSEYGEDYQKFESDVMRFVGSDARLAQRYNEMWKHDPEGAMDWAFLKFGQSRRKGTPAEPNGELREQRSGASVPTGQGSPERGGQDVTEQQLGQLWDEYRKSGDPDAAARYAKAKLLSLPSVQRQIRAAGGEF